MFEVALGMVRLACCKEKTEDKNKRTENTKTYIEKRQRSCKDFKRHMDKYNMDFTDKGISLPHPNLNWVLS